MNNSFTEKNAPCFFSSNRNSPTATILGLFTTLSVIAVYNSIFFNRYFPLSEGWFSVYAKYILRGAVPYRDFQLALPPLYPLKLAAIMYLFGESFITLRIIGIFLILIMSSVLFLLYARLFPVYIAAIVTIVSIMYYQSGVAHITYDFIQFVTTYAIISTYLICRYFEADNYSLKTKDGLLANIFLTLAGMFAAAAFLTKQSNGFFVLLFSLFAVVIVSLKVSFRHSIKNASIYLLGTSLPIITIISWLWVEGALPSFLQQTVFGAAKAKGTLLPILFAWFPRLMTQNNVTALIQVTMAILSMRYGNFLHGRIGKSERTEYSFPLTKNILLLWMIFVLSIVCILLPLYNIQLSKDVLTISFFNWIFYNVLIIVSSVVSLTMFIIYSFMSLTDNKKEYTTILVIATVSVGLLYGTGTSATIAEAGAILAIGLVLGYLLFVRSPYNVGKIIFLSVCFILIFQFSSKKYTEPYLWWGLAQPDIRTATQPAEIKSLEGFILSEDTRHVIFEVKSIVEKYTTSDENIFTFPNIPLFYLLTNRFPVTFSMVHWFDVVPDELAIKEAQKILDVPPKVIISLDMPEVVWTGHEQGFRGGAPSGQRAIQKSIEKLVSDTNRYILEAKFIVPHDYVLKVWRRI